MSRIILLDSGPLGLITNPRPHPEAQASKKWLATLLAAGVRILVPEITDYEVRRELLRAGKLRGVQNLDLIARQIGYLPLNTATLRQAALFWAKLRQQVCPLPTLLRLMGTLFLPRKHSN